MKQIQHALLIFLFLFLLIFSHSTASARLLPPHQGEEMMTADGMSHDAGLPIKTEEDDLFNLMGLEECDDEKDDGCLKRRVVAEAHLDYIYTQRHKPKASP
ncbi:putative phytosulfokines 6 [Cornus florida]|uniref:putative phytosulfokines 6 n=1 Tax=Cornus florida TaxID=4283 RepID=UPI0028A1DD2C|nr:putative phytosulfokines 6 [Cornus florida]